MCWVTIAGGNILSESIASSSPTSILSAIAHVRPVERSKVKGQPKVIPFNGYVTNNSTNVL